MPLLVLASNLTVLVPFGPHCDSSSGVITVLKMAPSSFNGASSAATCRIKLLRRAPAPGLNSSRQILIPLFPLCGGVLHCTDLSGLVFDTGKAGGECLVYLRQRVGVTIMFARLLTQRM
jgi:hypothetical protein